MCWCLGLKMVPPQRAIAGESDSQREEVTFPSHSELQHSPLGLLVLSVSTILEIAVHLLGDRSQPMPVPEALSSVHVLPGYQGRPGPCPAQGHRRWRPGRVCRLPGSPGQHGGGASGMRCGFQPLLVISLDQFHYLSSGNGSPCQPGKVVAGVWTWFSTFLTMEPERSGSRPCGGRSGDGE
jgi:hypothetical protein